MTGFNIHVNMAVNIGTAGNHRMRDNRLLCCIPILSILASIMDSLTNSPKRLPRKKTEKYSMCFLYNTGESLAKLTGLTVATCNPTSERSRPSSAKETDKEVQGN